MSSDEESIKAISDIDDDNEQHNNLVETGDDALQEEDNVNTEEVQRDEATEGNQDEERNVIKPKRVIRNPQPKLNENTLKGPRGLTALTSYFERVKFKGKGYEHQDLNVVMKTYEYWCHRLFPKFPFDTCIERLEKLGHKRAVQTHVKRIRFDLIIDEDKPIVDSSDEENNVDGFVDEVNQQFDSLLASSESEQLTEEQLERIKLNKDRAEKLRQERLRKIREKAEVNNLEISSQVPGTSGLDNEITEEQFSSSQSDVVNEMSDEGTFDMESNIKGKFNRNSVKKKSSRKVINSIESHNEDSEESVKNKLDNRMDDSDQETHTRNRKRGADSDESDLECDVVIPETFALREELDSEMEVELQAETLLVKSQSLLANLENKENSSADNIIS